MLGLSWLGLSWLAGCSEMVGTRVRQEPVVAGTSCVTVPPVEASLRKSLDRVARAEFGQHISPDATLCWKMQKPTGFSLGGAYPVAPTVPTPRSVGIAVLSEWYELNCAQGRTAWGCVEPRRMRTLQLERPVMLSMSVSDDALPQFFTVLEELKKRVPSTGTIRLPTWRFGILKEAELGLALTRIDGISMDAQRHTFNIGMDEGDDTLVLTVPYD
jgi:hypothetical protein